MSPTQKIPSGARVLVTGGAGFIGTHLCRALVKKGYRVSVLDVQAPATAVEGVEYVRGDVRDAKVLEKCIQGVQAVYHYAAMVSVPLCQEKPIESYEVNLLATNQVLEAIRKESARQGFPVRLVFAGSSVVYGNLGREGVALKEDGPKDDPRSFYGAQKLGCEHMIRLYCDTYGTPAVVFRFFNVYGPGQDPKSPYSGVISIFSSAVLEGRPLQLNGGGTLTRDFVSVHDLVRACAQALELPGSECQGKAINLGSGQMLTVRGLAEEMQKVSGRKVEMRDAPFRSGDVLHSLADIHRARELLGWKPEVSLGEGLEELLQVGS